MICHGCLQDVPDLVGPAKELCRACYGFVAEDLIPSLLAGMAESEGEEHEVFFQELCEEFPDAQEFEAPPQYFPYADKTEAAPTFRGRPRF